MAGAGGGARDEEMSSGGELAFVALHGVVKLLDTVFWVFGKGLIAAALAVVGLVARLILGEDAVAQTGLHGGIDGRRNRDSGDEALAELLSGPVDRRVSEAAKGDAKKLREKHVGWCEWYADHDVGTLLDREKPAFEIVKAFYPHAFHAKTKQGFAVQLEKPGRFPTLLAELRKRGFADPTNAVVEHVSFVMTHAFATIDNRDFPQGRILRIVDMSRLDLSDTGYEAYVFLKAMAHVSSVAFPERVHKVVIVNPPAAFNVLWGVFSPMVSQRTMARVRICKDTQSAKETLLEDLDIRDIPREYGGECACGAKRGRKKNCGGDETSARDGGGARLRGCPSAECTSCWRDAPLEREFWDRVRLSNGGAHGGVAGHSGSKRDGTRRDGTHRRRSTDRETPASVGVSRESRLSGSGAFAIRESDHRGRRTDRRGRREGDEPREEADEKSSKTFTTDGGEPPRQGSKKTRRGSSLRSSSLRGSRGNLQSLTESAFGDVETVRASAPPVFAAPRARPPEPAAAHAAEPKDGEGNGSWFF